MSKRKRRLGDRYDGRLLRTLDPFYKIIPYIMKTRVDAQNFLKIKLRSVILRNSLSKKEKKRVKESASSM